MSTPFPPTVHGPLIPSSVAVMVTGVMPDADVTVFADGTSVGTAHSTQPGSLSVPLSVKLAIDQKVTAAQKTVAGPSDPSPEPEQVVDVPDPLPSPVFDSALTVCMSAVQVAGLVPGASVEVKAAGTPVATATTGQTVEVLNLLPTATLTVGGTLTVVQTVPGSLAASPVVPSLLVASVVPAEGDLPEPGIATPLQCGFTTLHPFGVVPSADLVVENEGNTTVWLNVSAAYNANGSPPLKEGKLVAKQVMPRCQRGGRAVTLPVGPADPPGPPEFVGEVCSDLKKIKLKKLVPGSVITFYLRTFSPATPSTYTEVELGSSGVSKTEEGFPFDPKLLTATTPPPGQVNGVTARMTICNKVGPYATPVFLAAGGPFPAPTIAQPLVECAPFISLNGAHVGSEVRAFSTVTGKPLSEPVTVEVPDFPLFTWFRLKANDKVVVRQRGCNANGEAGPAVVDSLPSPFPVPQIERPVRPHASTVHIHGIVPGARVHLLVNNRVRVSLDSPSRELFISPGFPPLADRDGLWAVQTLCDKRSSLEGVQVPVEKGRLKVNVSPSPVERGKSTLVTVTAQDADTGAAVVGATVSLNGSAVGVTGTAFAFAPALGQPNPSGVVSSPVAYIDEPFTITLKDPPPKEPAKLFLNVGPSTLVIGALQLSSAKWMVQTGWGSPTINATGINTVVPVPDPPAGTPAANKIVRITLACEAKANGWINGYAYSGTFTCHNRPGSPDPVGVAWDGKNWSVSWLALFDQFLDGNGVPTIIVTVGWTATVAA